MDNTMPEETPTRLTMGYMVFNDEDEMDLSPVPFREDTEQSSQRIFFPEGMPLRRSLGDGDYAPVSFSLQPIMLNGLNYLNFVTYLVHLFVSYGIGVWGLDGLIATRWDISQEYETLVTPAKWAYYLWAPILIFEAIFAVAQLFREFRALPIIQDGTGFFFFYTCLLQTAWTLFFSFRLFILSFVAVVASFLSLASLVASQHFSQVRGRQSRVEYWLFRFPFFLHCGWMAVMVVVHLALLCRHLTSNLGTQLAADMVALALLLPVASYVLSGDHVAVDFVIPSVIIWSYIGIACRLHRPSESLLDDYGETVVDAVWLTSYIFAGIVSCLTIPRLVIWVCHEFLTIQVVMVEDSYTE